ncbi:hypothetical protein BGP_3166 [Beggiatoa sp. PS]|nr:hypothetical protein BGP_3166 [Beggiatoa sp. PS]
MEFQRQAHFSPSTNLTIQKNKNTHHTQTLQSIYLNTKTKTTPPHPKKHHNEIKPQKRQHTTTIPSSKFPHPQQHQKQ